MAVLDSNQVAVAAFHLTTSASAAELADELSKRLYKPTKSNAVGWGSINDDAGVVKLPPNGNFSPGKPIAISASADRLESLRARYYWLGTNTVARRQQGSSAPWKAITLQEAADVLLWRDSSGEYSGVVTDRNNRSRAISALREAALRLDPKAIVRQDTIPEAMNADFFLWLMHRARNDSKVSSAMRIAGVAQVSSTDGQSRSVDVKDGATLDRIELAAGIALGITGFGPAKFGLDDDNVGAHFFLELHPDGGYQPYKSSQYNDPTVIPDEEKMLHLIEDLWVRTLPELRRLHSADTAWTTGGPQRFRSQALDEVRRLLRLT